MGFFRKKETKEDHDMSPIEMYIAGGGDMSTASPGTAAILFEAERSRMEREREERK